MVSKLKRQRVFMIGAGALGCEFLKMFSLMGMSQRNKQNENQIEEEKAQDGCVIVTDDDQIEMSNLNRQFLFRKENVG